MRENQNILDRVRLVVSQNDSSPVVNVDRLGRSIHYININQNILDRVRLVVEQKALFFTWKCENEGRSNSNNKNEYILDN